MATRQVSAIAAEPAKGGKGKPTPLATLRPYGWLDWVSVGLLVLLGVLLTAGVLVWFGLDHKGGGGFVSKTITTTGTGATQNVTETDYGDTVVIFALTVGALFILAGTLYGRLRDITLGTLKIDLEDEEIAANGADTPTPKKPVDQAQ